MNDVTFCSVCSDNFIINKTMIICKFCQKKLHAHCAKVKETLCRSVSDSDNLYWFCDTCLPVVDEKLASNLPTPFASQKFQDSIESIIHTVVGSMLNEFASQQATGILVVEDRISNLMTEVNSLRESNGEIISLLGRGAAYQKEPVQNPLMGEVQSAGGSGGSGPQPAVLCHPVSPML